MYFGNHKCSKSPLAPHEWQIQGQNQVPDNPVEVRDLIVNMWKAIYIKYVTLYSSRGSILLCQRNKVLKKN